MLDLIQQKENFIELLSNV